jgi:hypothetical protein
MESAAHPGAANIRHVRSRNDNGIFTGVPSVASDFDNHCSQNPILRHPRLGRGAAAPQLALIIGLKSPTTGMTVIFARGVRVELKSAVPQLLGNPVGNAFGIEHDFPGLGRGRHPFRYPWACAQMCNRIGRLICAIRPQQFRAARQFEIVVFNYFSSGSLQFGVSSVIRT